MISASPPNGFASMTTHTKAARTPLALQPSPTGLPLRQTQPICVVQPVSTDCPSRGCALRSVRELERMARNAQGETMNIDEGCRTLRASTLAERLWPNGRHHNANGQIIPARIGGRGKTAPQVPSRA